MSSSEASSGSFSRRSRTSSLAVFIGHTSVGHILHRSSERGGEALWFRPDNDSGDEPQSGAGRQRLVRRNQGAPLVGSIAVLAGPVDFLTGHRKFQPNFRPLPAVRLPCEALFRKFRRSLSLDVLPQRSQMIRGGEPRRSIS